MGKLRDWWNRGRQRQLARGWAGASSTSRDEADSSVGILARYIR
jgi:hypothetical protein